MRKQLLLLCLLCAFSGLYAMPVISVLSGSTTMCSGQVVTLHSSVSQGIQWYRNNVATTVTTQDYAITTAGTYTIKTTTGSTSNAITVTVLAAPNATVTPAGTNNTLYLCPGGILTLTSNYAGTGGTYLWNTGATTGNLVVTTPGDYWVKVTTSGGCSTVSDKKTVVMLPAPTAPTITANGATTVCSGSSVQLTTSAQAAGYQWYRNNVAIGGATSSTYAASMTGTYKVKTSNGTCWSTYSNGINVTINPLPMVSISPAGTNGIIELCKGSTVTLTASTLFGATYRWNNGETTQSINVTTAGDYWVTITSPNGCSNISGKKTIKMIAPAATTISASGNTDICIGNSVTLSAAPAAGYQWLKDNVMINGATSSTYVAAGTGSYSVQTTEGACYSENSNLITVTVHGFPIASIVEGSSITKCSNSSTTLTAAVNSQAVTYLWSNGATTQSITVNTPGSYSVTVTNQAGCSRTSSATTISNFNPVTVNAGNDTSIWYGYGSETATLNATATGDGPISFLWSTAATTQQISVSPHSTTTYSVTATDVNGCQATDDVTVDVVDVRCSNDSSKVFMCHMDPGAEAYTICVNPDAIASHLAHDDEIGPCVIEHNQRKAGYSVTTDSEAETTFTIYPNPFNETITLTYSLTQETNVQIDIYNVLGNKVKTINSTKQPQGSYQLSVDMKEEQISDGVYFIHYNNGKQTVIERMIKSKE